MNDTLSLSQKIYLLAIHPKKGGLVGPAQNGIHFVLSGLLLLEMYLKKNISFEDNRVGLLNPKTDELLHRFLLEKITKSEKELKIFTWINKFSFSRNFIKKEMQNSLVQKRIIRMQPKRFLFISWESPEIVNFQVVYKLQAEIENYIFKETEVEEELILLSFLKPAGLMQRLFPEREKRKSTQLKLKNMLAKNQVSMAVSNAISASQAVVASVVAITAATSASR